MMAPGPVREIGMAFGYSLPGNEKDTRLWNR
jgi:hypothetical protein